MVDNQAQPGTVPEVGVPQSAGWAGRIVLGTMVVCLASCASKRTVTNTGRAPAVGIDKYMLTNRDIKYGEAGSDEEGLIIGGKRSQFEGRRQSTFGGEVSGDSYQKKNYTTSNWDGSKEAVSKSYSGSEDGKRFQLSSIFGKKKAKEGSQQSRFAGTAATTSHYATGSARETGAERFEKPSDAKTDFRRRVYPEPPKRTLREHQEMTVDQTNSLLGRN